MDRAEKIGLGVATAGHVLLFGLLSSGFLATPNPLKLNSPPMDVSLVDEVALKSMAPQVSTQPPPPSVAPEQGPTEDASPAPAPEPAPQPEPTPAPPAPPKPVAKPAPPKPTPAPPKKDVPAAKPKPKPAPEKPKPAAAAPAKASQKPAAKPKPDSPNRASGQGKADKPKGSLLGKDFLKGINAEDDAPRKPAPPPAAAMGPAQKAALDAEIRRQLKPYWKSPSGADIEQLRTFVDVQLSRDGSLAGQPQVVNTTGITASNRAQVTLHQELAVKAIRLAAPFKLPPDLYDGWKSLRISFDKRLSQ
ncbi:MULTISPECIES: TonB C-terminal domain-containing protein [unclassified Sphingobium]|uniref:TonB C-terminal domain-containing protein n=1 Tax=unclassified Sphingobium TaxID=2611147 RepID=UPI0007702286|nr:MULTISPECIES: TonB C-terminal domain-containing protein [unclassified Sphingobium]AMK21173.1 putative TolA protein [Sphingobium sp. TKS]NML89754.1 TonB C-terminal domain-containing protein [Sphingobium sp. TB-6]